MKYTFILMAFFLEDRWAGRGQGYFLSIGEETILEQVGQRHEDLEWKREYYHIFFPSKDLEILRLERRR